METHVWLHVETLVSRQSFYDMHRLGQDKQLLQAVCDLVRHELDKVGHELLQTWVILQTRKASYPVVLLRFVQYRGADFLEVEL